MKITFFGGALTVTGSKYLVEEDDHRCLVDCGLFQGLKNLRLRNWAPFPIDPKTIEAVLLTHAHLDHTGYLPLLVKQGFSRPVYASPLTVELTKLILLDAGRIQEEDAKRANRHGYSKHTPALPLYREADAEAANRLLTPVDFYQEKAIGAFTFSLSHSGHISGSSFITLKSPNITVLFSGDLGRPNDPLMRHPDPVAYADYLLLESTYGGRLHPQVDNAEEIEKIINETQGKVIMASFALGRAQTLLYYIAKLKQEGRIPQNLPVYLDSPMGQKVTEVFCEYPDETRLPTNDVAYLCNVPHFISTPEQSKRLKESNLPAIIIASSGMVEGGRVLHHIKNFGTDPNNTIVLTGYQAEGTRGDRLLRGEREIKIFGDFVPIRARVVELDNLSSHADAGEIMGWLKKFQTPPKKTFLTHGEEEGATLLKAKIEQELGWNVVIPHYLETVIL